MQELLSWDSVWTEDLVALMVPVAEEAEALREERQFSTVSSVLDPRAQEGLRQWVEGVRQRTRQAQLAARGQRDEAGDIEKLIEDFGDKGP